VAQGSKALVLASLQGRVRMELGSAAEQASHVMKSEAEVCTYAAVPDGEGHLDGGTPPPPVARRRPSRWMVNSALLCVGLLLGVKLQRRAGAATTAPAEAQTESLVGFSASAAIEVNKTHLAGTWLFGTEHARCFIQPVGDGDIQFSVPLPRKQIALGTLHLDFPWWVARLTADDGEHVGSIRLSLLDEKSMTTNFKYPGETEWGDDTVAWKDEPKARPGQPPPPGPRPEGKTPTKPALRWEVATSHGLNVRERPDATAAVVTTKWRGTVVKGWRDGAWLRLESGKGYMLITDHTRLFLKCLDEEQGPSHPAAPHVAPAPYVPPHLPRPAPAYPHVAPAPYVPAPHSNTISLPIPRPTPAPTPPSMQTPHDNGKIGTWTVTTANGLNVRQSANPLAIILDNKVRGSLIRGRLVGGGTWLKLANEPGFMMVSSGGRELLRRSTLPQ